MKSKQLVGERNVDPDLSRCEACGAAVLRLLGRWTGEPVIADATPYEAERTPDSPFIVRNDVLGIGGIRPDVPAGWLTGPMHLLHDCSRYGKDAA